MFGLLDRFSSEPKELKFDVEELASMRAKVRDDAEEITKLKNELMQKLEVLKKDWKTLAGEKFFKDIDENWYKEVEKFVKYLEAVEELLATAETSYSEVEEATSKINF